MKLLPYDYEKSKQNIDKLKQYLSFSKAMKLALLGFTILTLSILVIYLIINIIF